MKCNALMQYIGTETGTTRDGKTYTRIGLLQGLDSEKVYISDEMLEKVKGMKPFTPVDCTLNIQFNGDRTYVNLLDIVPNLK